MRLLPTPVLSTDWSVFNEELTTMLSPIHAEVVNNVTTPSEAARECTLTSITLKSSSSLWLTTSSTSDRAPIKTYGHHQVQSKKKLFIYRSEFLNAIRAQNKTVKAVSELQHHWSARNLERAFRCNPWKFSKSVCDEPIQQLPKFSQMSCLIQWSMFNPFKLTYNLHRSSRVGCWSDALPWSCVRVWFITYYSRLGETYLTKMLNILFSWLRPNLTYFHLRKLPSTHHFLSTLFSRIFLETH